VQAGFRVPADPDALRLFPDRRSEPPPPDELVAFRYCDYDVPFWASANTRPGRWNTARSEPTQYWSLSPEGAWAELIRYEGLTTEAELDLVRMPIWVCRVARTGIAHLRQSSVRDHYNLTRSELTSDNVTACQQAAARLRRDHRGILAPSAALQDATNLTLFGPRRLIGLDKQPALTMAVPGAVVAVGRPPHGLVGRVTILSSAQPALF
jgi:RES domain-containing protein